MRDVLRVAGQVSAMYCESGCIWDGDLELTERRYWPTFDMREVVEVVAKAIGGCIPTGLESDGGTGRGFF